MRLPDDVSIVMAAKNEARSIGAIVTACRPLAAEVIVVADRECHDRTVAVAEAAGARVIVDAGRGKGHAMVRGLAEVRTAITVFIDADGSHDPADIPKLVAPLVNGAAEHVSASRLTGGSSELHGGFDEFFRLAGSSFITACINWRFGVRLSDSQNGFRAILTDVCRDLGLTSQSTTIEQEMIMKSLRRGYRIVEVPSHEHERLFGSSNISVRRDCLKYALSLLTGLAFAGSARTRSAAVAVERGAAVPR